MVTNISTIRLVNPESESIKIAGKLGNMDLKSIKVGTYIRNVNKL